MPKESVPAPVGRSIEFTCPSSERATNGPRVEFDSGNHANRGGGAYRDFAAPARP